MKNYKNILTGFFVIIASPLLHAQDLSNLLNEAWEVESYYGQFNGNELIHYYHIDSTDNTQTFEGIIYEFNANGMYDISIEDTINRTDEWEIYSNGDSLLLSGVSYKLVSISESEMLLKQSGTSFNVPIEYFFKLKPALFVGTELEKAETKFTLFPIPNNGEFTLYMNTDLSKSASHLSLYSLDGQLLKETALKGNSSVTLSFNSLLNGMYIIKMYGNDNELLGTKKIIIQN